MTDITLGITLTGDASGLRGEVKLTTADLKKLQKEAGEVGAAGTRGGRGVDNMRKAARRWTNTAKRANDQTKQLARGYDGARRRADLLRVAVLALATGVAARVVGSFIDAASQTENLRTRLRFLTDDADAATDAILGYAAKVPFAFETIQQAAPILLTVARDQAEFNKLLEITGDVATVAGLSYVETAQQLQRSFSAGINSADLFRERGVRSMLGFQAGVESSAEATRARILELWDDSSFALVGASMEMADTWTGLTSMMGDKWFQFRQRLMNAEPFDFLKAVTAELNAELDRNFGSIGEAADSMGERLVDMVEDVALGAAAAADTLKPIGDAAVDVVNRLIETFNGLPPLAQQAGVFGTLLFGKRFGVMFFGGMMLADEMARLSKEVLDEAGVDQDSILRDIFVGVQPIEADPMETIGPAETAVTDFLARVRARMAEARAAAEEGAAGRGGPGGGGGAGGGASAELDKVRTKLQQENAELQRLAEAWFTYGGSVAEAELQNEIAAQLRAAKVSALSEEGKEIARLVRANADYAQAIDDAEAAGRRHEETVENIRQKLADTRPAYEQARIAAATWRDEQLAGLDATKAGYQSFRDQVDEIFNHMLKEAYEGSLADSRRWEDGVTRGFRSYAKEAMDAGAAAEEGVTGSFKNMEDALVDFTTTGKIQFGSLVNSMISDLVRLTYRQTISGPIAELLGGVDFGALLFGSVAGRPPGAAGTGAGVSNAATPRAHGGPVAAGRPYLVGELGPELMVPRTSGQIFDSGDTARMLAGRGGGSGMTVHMTLNNPTRDMIPEIIAALRGLGAKVNQLDGGLESRAVSAVAEARGRDPELFGGVA